MAGETTKSTSVRVNREVFEKFDTAAFATGELESGDVKIYQNISMPTSAVPLDIKILCDDLDSDGSPAVLLDIGVAAAEDFTSVTSSSATQHSADAVLDADILCDAITNAQAAVTSWTSVALDTATMGPDDIGKEIWELLGYDEDPRSTVNICVTVATVPTAAAAGDVALLVKYAN